MKEEGNQVYALDYNADGSKFATGGMDCRVSSNSILSSFFSLLSAII